MDVALLQVVTNSNDLNGTYREPDRGQLIRYANHQYAVGLEPNKSSTARVDFDKRIVFLRRDK